MDFRAFLQPINPLLPDEPVTPTDKLNGISRAIFDVLRRNEDNSLRNVIIGLVLLALGWAVARYLAKQREAQQTQTWIDTMAVEEVEPAPAGTRQRRQWVRVQGDVPVEFEVQSGPSRGTRLRETVRDISAGGLSLVTDGPCAVGQRVKLWLDLGFSKSAFEAQGTVVRVGPSKGAGRSGVSREFVGIRFEGITPAERERIMRWVFRKQRQIAELTMRVSNKLCIGCGKGLRPPFDPDPMHCQKCVKAMEAERVIQEFRKRGASLPPARASVPPGASTPSAPPPRTSVRPAAAPRAARSIPPGPAPNKTRSQPPRPR